MMLKEDLEKTELFHAEKYMDCDCWLLLSIEISGLDLFGRDTIENPKKMSTKIWSLYNLKLDYLICDIKLFLGDTASHLS